jgi:hypothetical protein
VRRLLLAVAGLVMSSVLVISCSRGSRGPVQVNPPNPDAEVAARCSHLVDDLPSVVDSLPPRGLSPARALGRAWGSPPIVLRCGVPPPRGFGPTSRCVTVNGVDWYADQRGGGYVFTTVGRTAGVEVSVPDEYRPEVNALVDVTRAIKANTRSTHPCV